MTNGELGEKNVNKVGEGFNLGLTVIVDLPNGRRVASYDSDATAADEVTERVLAEYEAAAPLVELAEDTARRLGQSAKSLLEMAIVRLETSE